MTTVEFLASLAELEIRVWAEGGNLRVRAPRGALTSDTREQLAERKMEILALLQANEASTRSAGPPPQPVAREGALPLSFAQERLWFLHHMAPDSAAYNIVSAVRFERAIDPAILERALTELARRHETLRTTFRTVDGQPTLDIAPPAAVRVPIADLRQLPEDRRRAEFERLRTAHAEEPFDLERGPLMRVSLLRAGEDDWTLLLALHHIVSDRWSIGVLINELQALYRDFASAGRSSLPELPVQYVDFAAWQRERVQGSLLETQLAFWRQQLGDNPPVLDLATDRPRPVTQTHRGAWETRLLEDGIGEAVRTTAATAGVTPFMIFLAAFDTLLYRYTGQTDILVGSPMSGRTHESLEGLIGCFVNMIVFRSDLSGNPSFAELLRRVRETALGAYTHAEIPFEKLVADLQPRRDPSRSPFFQVAIMFQSAPRAVEMRSDVSASSSGGTLFDLTLFVTEVQGRFILTAEYNVDLFDRTTIARMLEHLEILLVAALADPQRSIATLPFLSDAEQQRVVAEWNSTKAPLDADACIHRSIAHQAARTPDKIAVVCEQQSLTYGELDRRAGQLARYLVSRGVGPETLVGICVERSVSMIVALLGTLKAGATYVPLDPSYPAERLDYMLRDAGIAILLTQEALVDELPAGDRTVVCVDSEWPAIAAAAGGDPAAAAADDQLAYVIYTSGSTGRPKGVQVPHRALANLIASMAQAPGLRGDDVLVSVTTLSFDIAGLELYLPLVQGATLVIATRDEASDGGLLMERLASAQATVMQATPATWRLLLQAGWTGGLRKLLCGGEALPRDLVAELLPLGGELWNMYGPTETTIWSSVDRVTADALVTIGRPIANTQMYVLDARLQPMPIGVPGELYIAGDGVARGYRGQPAMTAERFVPNPFGAGGSRMYRTGDLARHLPDGRLECLGRVDQQVKVRGFRIELGEIETALAAHPLVHEAAVYAEEMTAGDKRLVAYVVYEPGESLTASELRRFLRTTLPDYMVPSFFMKLDRIPLTPNGKVDRRALPNAFKGSQPDAERVAPKTATERAIADIWQRSLGVAAVSAEDNFFDIGGHSLLSMRVIAEIERTLGHRLQPRAMFMENLKQIAEWCDRRAASGAAVRETANMDVRGASLGFSKV